MWCLPACEVVRRRLETFLAWMEGTEGESMVEVTVAIVVDAVDGSEVRTCTAKGTDQLKSALVQRASNERSAVDENRVRRPSIGQAA